MVLCHQRLTIINSKKIGISTKMYYYIFLHFFCHPSITLSYQTVAENAWKKLVGRGEKNLSITESGMVKIDDTWAAPLLHGRSVFGGDLFLKVYW